MIHTVEKKIAATTGALKQMKRANKYDKSISAKQKMIERMQKELKALRARVPKKRKPLILQLEATDKASMDVLQMDGATKIFEGLNRPLLNNQDLEVRKGDRIGIVGGNGQGKTTLLKRIIVDEKPTTEIHALAPGAEFGHFPQKYGTHVVHLIGAEQSQ